MVKFEKYTMPAADLGALNPMPDIKNMQYIHAGYQVTENVSQEEMENLGKGMISTMLPYMMQDNYNRDKKLRYFNAAVLENDKLKAVFLPELGGRLWSLYDKVKGRELLYVNPVFQPGNLALRNAWFSGGVEFNVGIKGHTPLTCSPLWCAVDTTEDGDVLRLYEYERIRKVVYSINAYLPEDSDVLYIKNRIENLTDDDKYMYWWSNIAVPETEETRVIVPANEAFISFYNANKYLVDKISVPFVDGIDTSYPKRIPAARDFFYKIPDNKYSWIAAADKNGEGLMQCSTKRLYARKLFVWGKSQGGRNWNEWLSKENSTYIEIQAGLAHTQLEHIPMKAGEVWEWCEAYTAFDAPREVVHGDFNAAADFGEKYMFQKVGDIEKFVFPTDKGVISSKIIYKGSDWGAVAEKIAGKRISNLCLFPEKDDEETKMWHNLFDNHVFEAPNPDFIPQSYVVEDALLQKLETLKEQNFYSLLQIGVIKYAKNDLWGAEEAWHKSVAATPNCWAYRNLAMLYKNEYKDLAKGVEFILKAFSLKQDNQSLCFETANILVEANKNAEWINIFDGLNDTLKQNGRLRFLKALALLNVNELEKATEIINKDFVMPDIKEGELSVSDLWFSIYRRLYAKEQGIEYDENNKELKTAADKKYPIPKKLDFRMHVEE